MQQFAQQAIAISSDTIFLQKTLILGLVQALGKILVARLLKSPYITPKQT